MSILNSKVSKIVVGVLAVAVLVIGFGAVKINKASAAVTAAGIQSAVTVKSGSTGASAMMWQEFLNTYGGASLVVDGKFGPLSAAAAKVWQAGRGLVADGILGALSRAAAVAQIGGGAPVSGLPAGCTSTSGFSPITGGSCSVSSTLPAGCQPGYAFSVTTGQSCTGAQVGVPAGLAGTSGNISDVTTLSQYNDEEVGQSQSDVKVAGFDVEASNDGDIQLVSLKLVFDPTGNASGDSDNLKDYIESVKIWQGSTEIGSADVSDFSERSDDTFSKTITLNNSIVKADQTQKFYVTVDSQNNLDSGDIDSDDWSVAIENIRFLDGSGVVTTETAAIPTGAGEIGWDSTDDGVEMDFVSFATAANTELKISTDSSTPEAGIVIIDDTDTTEDVVLLKGKLKLEGTSDAVLDEFPVTLTASTLIDNIVGSVKLKIGSEEYTESVGANCDTDCGTVATSSVTFDNLDFNIDAGDTVNFTVYADINDIEAGVLNTSFNEGDTLEADVTASNRALIDIENEEGDQLDDTTEKSGIANGEEQEFRTAGVMLSFVSGSSTVTNNDGVDNDSGTFTLKFKVKAVGDTVYVSSLADASITDVTLGQTSVFVDRAGTGTIAGTSAVLTNLTDTDLNAAGLYTIEDGEEHTFEVTTSVSLSTTGQGGLWRAVLGGLYWDTDSTDATPENLYNSNLDNFKTSYTTLN